MVSTSDFELCADASVAIRKPEFESLFGYHFCVRCLFFLPGWGDARFKRQVHTSLRGIGTASLQRDAATQGCAVSMTRTHYMYFIVLVLVKSSQPHRGQ